MKPLKNQKGMTLLEVLFAIGILGVGVYVIVEGVNQMESASRQTRDLSTTERQINAIVDNIRTGLGSYQITYDSSDAVREDMLKVENLPMAWTAGAVVAVEDCVVTKNCPPARFGFIIQPIASSSLRGLYIVTLRMTNPDWKEKFRDYQFLATIQ